MELLADSARTLAILAPPPGPASHLCQVSRGGWSAFYLPRAWAGRGPGSEGTMQEREGECGRPVSSLDGRTFQVDDMDGPAVAGDLVILHPESGERVLG